MDAIDTNIVVRYLVRDDPPQMDRAQRLIDGCNVFVSDTILLDTECILRSIFRFACEEVLRALAAFVALPSVHMRGMAAAEEALRLMAAGMDFADALHLVSAEDCDTFITFDRALARRASSESAAKVRLL